MDRNLKQLSILHFSDLHFGQEHRFDPVTTPDSDVPDRRGIPTLLESLNMELENIVAESGIIIAFTGDLTQRAAPNEFDQVMQLFRGLAESSISGKILSRNELFVVPGNHDIVFTEPNKERRWQPYCSFYQNFFERLIFSNAPEKLTMVHDRSDDLGAVMTSGKTGGLKL